jgi:hypothetical protein
MMSGSLLIVCSLLVSALFYIFVEKLSHHRTAFLIFNFLEVLGLIIIVVSILTWSFSQSLRIKRIIWCVFGTLIFILIVPLTSYCPSVNHDNDPRTFDNDVVICEVVFPFEPFYWFKVFQNLFGTQNPVNDYRDNGFVPFGGIYLVTEKYDNFLEALRRAVK